MHIHDFHSKLTSNGVAAGEEGSLFQALRNLSLVEDIQTLFAQGTDDVLVDWVAWPPAGADAPYSLQA
ncbi:MAG TPA: hypothetical protein VGH73_24585 [Thermoanaerobaculia bacterium]|jgi:hypothetical protein